MQLFKNCKPIHLLSTNGLLNLLSPLGLLNERPYINGT